LWQEKHSRFASIARFKRLFEIAGDKKNLDVGMSRAKRIGETAPAHLRHNQVGEKEIDPSSAIFAEQAPRVSAVGRFDHFVAQTTEHAHGNVANTNVVFENKDGFGAAARYIACWSFI